MCYFYLLFLLPYLFVLSVNSIYDHRGVSSFSQVLYELLINIFPPVKISVILVQFQSM